MPTHRCISSCILSCVFSVSNIPGVSTIIISLLNLKRVWRKHCLVSDVPDKTDSKTSSPRMEFPVALLPAPVFPRRTILISLSKKVFLSVGMRLTGYENRMAWVRSYMRMLEAIEPTIRIIMKSLENFPVEGAEGIYDLMNLGVVFGRL